MTVKLGPSGWVMLMGFWVVRQRAGQFRIRVVSVLCRDRHDAEINDLGDFLVHHIHVGHQAVHGMGPGAVLGELLNKCESAENTAAPLFLVLKNAGGQRGDTDVLHVQITGGKGGEPPLIGCEEGLHHLKLFLQHREFAGDRRVQFPGGNDLSPGHRDENIGGRSAGHVVDENTEAAVLLRLATSRVHQSGIGDPLLRTQMAGGLQNFLDLGDFGARGQGVLGDGVSCCLSCCGGHGCLVSRTLGGSGLFSILVENKQKVRWITRPVIN